MKEKELNPNPSAVGATVWQSTGLLDLNYLLRSSAGSHSQVQVTLLNVAPHVRLCQGNKNGWLSSKPLAQL